MKFCQLVRKVLIVLLLFTIESCGSQKMGEDHLARPGGILTHSKTSQGLRVPPSNIRGDSIQSRRPSKVVKYSGITGKNPASKKTTFQNSNRGKSSSSFQKDQPQPHSTGTPEDLKVKAQNAYQRGNYIEALEYYHRLARRSPNSGEARFNVGAVQLALKDHKGAVRSFTDALEFGYRRGEVYHNLGLAYLGLRQPGAAVQVWSNARSAGISSAEIETALGYGELDERNFDAARKSFSQALKINGDYGPAHNGMALLALHQGELDLAIKGWKRAEASERMHKSLSVHGFAVRSFRGERVKNDSLGIFLGPDPAAITKSLEDAFQLAESGQFESAATRLQDLAPAFEANAGYWSMVGFVKVQLGDVTAAEAAWQKVMVIDDKDVTPYINLAVLEFGKANFVQVELLIEQALQREPGNPLALTLQGDLFAARERYREAEQLYEQALSHDPKLVTALNNLGIIRIRRGDVIDGLKLLDQALTVAENDPLLIRNMGMAYIVAGRLTDAERFLRQALEASPNDAELQLHLGYVFGTQGRLNEARTAFKVAYELDPESALALNNLGVVQQKQGDVRGAEEYYRSALKIDGQLGEGYNNLASILLARGERREALAAYEKAVAISSLDHESRRNLGTLLLKAGKVEEAVGHLQLALALQPRDLDTLFDLALAYRKMNKVSESITFFETFLEFAEGVGARSEQIIQAERALQRLRYP